MLNQQGGAAELSLTLAVYMLLGGEQYACSEKFAFFSPYGAVVAGLEANRRAQAAGTATGPLADLADTQESEPLTPSQEAGVRAGEVEET